jgi:hypothetical protein
MSITWLIKSGVDLGFLPAFLNERDPRPAKEQINSAYQHWNPLVGFKLMVSGTDPLDSVLEHVQSEERMEALAMCRLGSEWVFLFEYEFVAIWHPIRRTVEVSRVN